MLVHFNFEADETFIIWSRITENYTRRPCRTHLDILNDEDGKAAGVCLCHCAFEVTGLETAKRGFTKIIDLVPYADSNIPLAMLKAHPTKQRPQLTAGCAVKAIHPALNNTQSNTAQISALYAPATAAGCMTDRQRDSSDAAPYYGCYNDRSGNKNWTLKAARNRDLWEAQLAAEITLRDKKAAERSRRKKCETFEERTTKSEERKSPAGPAVTGIRNPAVKLTRGSSIWMSPVSSLPVQRAGPGCQAMPSDSRRAER